MKNAVRKFLAEEDGITALEYGLLAAIVAGVLVVVFGGANGPLQTLFGTIFTKITGIVNGA